MVLCKKIVEIYESAVVEVMNALALLYAYALWVLIRCDWYINDSNQY